MPAFMIDAAPLSAALALLAPVAAKSSGYQSQAPLSGILLEAGDDGVELTATDLETTARVRLACDVQARGRIVLPAIALRDAVKAAAKVKGSRCAFALADDGKVGLASGRSQMRLQPLPADAYPLMMRSADVPADVWSIAATDKALGDVRRDRFALGDGSTKALRRFAKYVGDVALVGARIDRADQPSELRLSSGDASLAMVADVPAYSYKRPAPARFTFRLNEGECAKARTYLDGLRDRLELPRIPCDDEGNTGGRLIVADGMALGVTYGATYFDQSKWIDLPDDYRMPDDVVVEYGEAEIDGRRIRNVRLAMGSGLPDRCQVWHVGTNALAYADGSYSLAMPRERSTCLSLDTVETADGVQPLGFATGGAIHLDADAVRALAGPVDPSTFVAIPRLSFLHGRIIARDGITAEGLRYVEPAAPTVRDGRKLRKMTDAEQLRAYSTPDLVAALQPQFIATDDSQGDAPAAEPVAVEPAPIAIALPEPVAEAVTDPAPAAPTIEAEVAPIPRAPVGNEAPADLSRRLERIEAALGLAPVAKRSPAHAAAIRRAWAMRVAMRQRAELDRAALLQVNGFNRILRDDLARLSARVEQAEAFAGGERPELVAEIDRLRAEVMAENANACAVSHVMRRRFVQFATSARGAARARAQVRRLRSERDGLAHNLAIMTSRATAEATALEALRSNLPSLAPLADGQPRRSFILSSR